MSKFVMVAILFLVGCGSMPIPEAGRPEDAIARAQERGSQDNPESQLYLKLAKDGVDKASAQKKDGDEDGAKLTLLKADADAKFALALLRRDDAKAKAAAIQAKIDKLKAEMGE